MPSGKSLGILSIILAGLGILVGAEEILAGVFAGAFEEGPARLEREVGSSVTTAGTALLAMSVFLLVVGILLVLARPSAWSFGRVWAVFGLLVSAGLAVNAITDTELLERLAERHRSAPGFINDLGAARPVAFALLALLPIALLVSGPKRRPLDAALTD